MIIAYVMDMDINADFAQPVFIKTQQLDWVPSPMAGVDRRMLDRVGDEVARATSIVRYAENSAFARHTHSGGEEFIVLDGVFSDEHGDYPAGTYVRNPVGTNHVPHSTDGCTIFVKLWQFDPDDQEQMTLDLNGLVHTPDPLRAGVRTAMLADRDYEQVVSEQWDGNAAHRLSEAGGFELLVIDGHIGVGGETYGRHDWIRLPGGGAVADSAADNAADSAADNGVQITAGADGAHVWIKRGHLGQIRVPQAPPRPG